MQPSSLLQRCSASALSLLLGACTAGCDPDASSSSSASSASSSGPSSSGAASSSGLTLPSSSHASSSAEALSSSPSVGDSSSVLASSSTSGAPSSSGTSGNPANACLAARATFYDATGTVNCGHNLTPMAIPSGIFGTTALNTAAYAGAAACGECYELTGPSSTLIVMVTDQCPAASNVQWCSGDLQHFDLDAPVFAALADPGLGVIHISARKIACPIAGTMQAYTMAGANAWWVAFHVFTHRVGLQSVEVRKAGQEEWLPAVRQDYNAWVYQDAQGVDAAGLQLRLTSVLGEVVVSTGRVLTTENSLVDLGVQFQVGWDAATDACAPPSPW